MPSKRKFCDHCKEFVKLRTDRLHADLYGNKTSETIDSSEEEEISCDDSENVDVVRACDDVANVATDEAEEVIGDQGNEITSPGTNEGCCTRFTSLLHSVKILRFYFSEVESFCPCFDWPTLYARLVQGLGQRI